MRVRKCMSRGILAKRVPLRRRAAQPVKPSLSAPKAVRPTQVFTHELHPTTVARSGLGAYKYTTGLLQSPSRDHRAAAFKIFSERPIGVSTWQNLRASVALEEITTKDVPAKSVFAALLATVLRPHATLPAVRDVHYQIFGSSRAFSARSARGKRVVVEGSSWDVRICLHRSSSLSAALRKPAIQLRTPYIKMREGCMIKSEDGTWRPQCRVLIDAHLATKFLEANRNMDSVGLQREQPAQSLGQLVLELMERAAQSPEGRVYEDASDVLINVKDSLRRWLPTSAIAAHVAIDYAEITVSDELRQRRYVSSTTLDASSGQPLRGTVRQPHAPEGPNNDGLLRQPTSKLGIMSELGITYVDQTVDTLLGLPGKLTANFHYEALEPGTELDTTPERIVQQFRQACIDVGVGGLSSYVAAWRSLAQRFPRVSASIVWQYKFAEEWLSPGSKTFGRTAALSFFLNRPVRDGSLKLAFPTIGLEQSGNSATGDLVRVRVRLHAEYNGSISGDKPVVAKAILPAEEVKRVAYMTDTVLQRVWKELVVVTDHMAAQTMAEALLRIIGFSEQELVLCRVDLAFDNPDPRSPSKTYHATVFKAAHHDDNVSSAHTTEAEAVVKQDGVANGRQHEVSAAPELPIDVPPTFIALGSNVGDRLSCIEEACRALDADPNIRVVKTSSLYETKAMYVEDQAPFLNGVCEVETSLSPMDLLDRTQAIENGLGRVKTVDKGPRNIDLDILLYGNTVMKTDRLTIPHPLMLERHFVLQPMSDVARMASLKHPETQQSFEKHTQKLAPLDEAMYTLTSLGEGCQTLRAYDHGKPTFVMSILNVTPDSFSDGGENATADMVSLRGTVRSHVAAGATIIDVGGQSSRPNAPDVTAEEEIRRILPAIEAIKSVPEAAGVAISVDTYRASVAEAGINAGAHIVNDISAGQLDPDMLQTVARLGCTYIMMHMRGTPATMMSEENCSYPDGLVFTVARELRERVDAALAAGIRRWRIILDPGIGFSKSVAGNLHLLTKVHALRRSHGLRRIPWLVGTSRKSFIGKITEVVTPKERSWGTAATVTEAVRGGADIVRVHDVAEMAKVVKMADAIYRV